MRYTPPTRFTYKTPTDFDFTLVDQGDGTVLVRIYKSGSGGKLMSSTPHSKEGARAFAMQQIKQLRAQGDTGACTCNPSRVRRLGHGRACPTWNKAESLVDRLVGD
jgi:hypothetical protein